MNLQGMLIERIENRVLIGITVFLATMVLVGWVAINETGRMASFQEQHLARSIEIGAELFAGQCAECHGAEGHGSARAPGLNNPQLFGYDFAASIDTEIAALETAKARIDTLQTSIAEPGDLSDDQVSDLEAQLAAMVEEFGESPAEGIDAQIAGLNADKEALLVQIQPAIERGYNPDSPSRLETLGWSGTLDSFVLTTLVGGRPVSEAYWPEPMPAWSQTASGPLRMDQLENITNYILNWGEGQDWTVDDLLAVEQFAKVPIEDLGVAPDFEAIAPEVVDIQMADVEANRGMIDEMISKVLPNLEGVAGDPNNGQALYNGALGCSACHGNAQIAPPTEGTWTRINETRLNAPELAGYTANQYLTESILVPNAYVAPGYAGNAMSQNFGGRLTVQDLADLIAYLQSQDGPDPLAE